jgi:hypothetical protein
MSERAVGRQFSITQRIINRHCKEHVGEALARYNICQPILNEIRILHLRTLRILDRVEREQNLVSALAAVRECRHNLTLLARLSGELKNPEPGEPTRVEIIYRDVPLPASRREPNDAVIEAPVQRLEIADEVDEDK